ncbi:amino acid permease, partial [bacterium]|nr:amino acid permease [bacterium]
MIKNKFGTFKGVFVPSTEAILGTVLFLLLPVLTADVGLFAILGIIVLAHTVTTATAFSMADCATNLNDVGPGGMYALARRSLGKAFGGSIGVQLYIAQAASIGFYAIGFAQPLTPILAPYLSGFIDVFAQSDAASLLFQRQLVASFFFIFFFGIVMIGADFTLKIQSLILVILGISVVTIFIVPFLGIEVNTVSLFAVENLNLAGNRPLSIALFFSVFAQFFPAVTGIDAGVGMSGDLANPKKSLVKGTFSAIAVTFVIYLISAVIFSFMNPKTVIAGYHNGLPLASMLTGLLGFDKAFPHNIPALIIVVGILFATGSSALSVFMTAPRTLQSLTINGVMPRWLHFLRFDFVKNGNEPRFALIFSAIIGFSIIWMGSINTASTIVGILFLMVYGWINGSAFLERVSGNPTFRPTSKGHWSINFYGFLVSIGAIMLFNWAVGVVIIVVQLILFKLILRYRAGNRLEGVWWGIMFAIGAKVFLSLGKIVQGSKNWRPVVTAISIAGKSGHPTAIAEISRVIASHQGLVHMNIVTTGEDSLRELFVPPKNMPFSRVQVRDITPAVSALVQASHPTGIEANTILLEYNDQMDSVAIIHRILEREVNTLLFKNASKFSSHKRIDIWWRGEKNGNLMVMLAWMMNGEAMKQKLEEYEIRLIRMPAVDADIESARAEMFDLLRRARLNGEVVIVGQQDKAFLSIVEDESS